MKPPTVFLGEMTNPEVEAFLETHHTVIIPTGATEQHGPHGPLLTDVLIPQEVARRVAPQIGAVVAPPINYALSYPHVGFTGLVHIRIPTFIALIADLCASFAASGFRRIVFLREHVRGDAASLSTVLTMRCSRFLVLCIFLCADATHGQSGWTPLWNGKDLDGWTTWMRQPEPGSDVPGLIKSANGNYTEPIGSGRDPLKVFTVLRDVDGRPAIRISGEVFGELRTKGTFRNYHLKLQFKWGAKKWPPRDRPATPRDSGLLYHVHAAPGEGGRTWARSIELQIQEHDVGDLYAIGSAIAVRAKARAGTQPPLYDYDPAGEWTFFSQSQGASGRCIKQPDNEKATGEWNTVELIAFGEDAIHIVNGTVVMRLHGPLRIDGDVPAPVTSGQIILQSEGAEVFYRDIEIRPITAIPSEFAAK